MAYMHPSSGLLMQSVPGIEVIQARVVSLTASSAQLDNGQTIDFDYACISTGSSYTMSGVIQSASASRAERLQEFKVGGWTESSDAKPC